MAYYTLVIATVLIIGREGFILQRKYRLRIIINIFKNLRKL